MEYEERWDNRQNEKEVVERYETMLAADDQVYFDIDELELVIEHYFEKSQLEKAVDVISYGLQLFPTAAILRLREAQILAVMGKLSKAIPKLKAIIELEPSNDEAYLSLASVYSQLRDHKNAINYYQKALSLSDAVFRDDIYVDMSLEFQSLGQWDDAIAILQRAMLSNPENETATYELAHCYEASDRLGLGVRYFTDFLEENPYCFSAWYNLGLIYIKQDEYAKAATALEFCAAIEGEFTPALHDLATCYFELDEYERAIDTISDIMAIEPPDASLLTFLGECFEKLENLPLALKYYDEAIEMDQVFMEAYLGKAVILDLMDLHEDAVVYLELASELDKSGMALTMLAEAYEKYNANNRAEETYERLTSAMPHLKEAWLSFAHFYGKKGKFEAALDIIEKALTENPHTGSLLYRKIAYLHALKQEQKALVLFDYVTASGYDEIEQLLNVYPEILNDATFALRIEEISK